MYDRLDLDQSIHCISTHAHTHINTCLSSSSGVLRVEDKKVVTLNKISHLCGDVLIGLCYGYEVFLFAVHV